MTTMLSFFGFSKDGAALNDAWRAEGCYASLFPVWVGRSYQIDTWFHSLFGIGDKLTIKKANWFLKTCILPSIPDRMKGHFVIERTFKKHRSAVFDKHNILPWLHVKCDTRFMMSNDIFTLFVALRYSHEYPYLIEKIYELGQKYPPDLAFLLAHMTLSSDGHALMCSSVFVPDDFDGKITKEWLLNWRFKDCWERFPILEPYSESGEKTYQLSLYYAPSGEETRRMTSVERNKYYSDDFDRDYLFKKCINLLEKP